MPHLPSLNIALFLKCQERHQRKISFALSSALHWSRRTRTQFSPVHLNISSFGRDQGFLSCCLRVVGLLQVITSWCAISGSLPHIVQVGFSSMFLLHLRSWTPRELEANFHAKTFSLGGTSKEKLSHHDLH